MTRNGDNRGARAPRSAGSTRAAHRGAAGLVVMLAAFIGAITGCSSSPPTIDGAKLAGNIQQDAAPTAVQLTEVDCPTGRVAKAGDRFQCTATVAAGGTLTYDVDITSDQGAYTYKLAPNQAIDGDAIAAEVTADIRAGAPAFADTVVTCPKTIVAPGGSASFTCTATTQGRQAELTVTKATGQPATWKFSSFSG